MLASLNDLGKDLSSVTSGRCQSAFQSHNYNVTTEKNSSPEDMPSGTQSCTKLFLTNNKDNKDMNPDLRKKNQIKYKQKPKQRLFK